MSENNDLVREFLLSYQNYNTRERYGRAVETFLEWFGKEPEIAGTLDLLEYLDQSDWSATTKHLHSTAIRQFYRYHYGKRHPINDVVVPKGNARKGRSLSWSKVDSLIALQDRTTAIGSRNIAIIRLMVDAGLRCHEVCNVKYAHVDFSQNQVEVHGKGDIWESVMFSETTANALRDWLVFRESECQCSNLFCSLSLAHVYRGKPLTRNGLQTIFKGWQEKVGFRVAPHDLRRSMATLLCEAGANTRIIQLQGRWKNLKEVERYTQNLRLKEVRRYLPGTTHSLN